LPKKKGFACVTGTCAFACSNFTAPSRLAFGTVTSLVGQLKAIFDDLGRKGEWTESVLLKFGNPVSSGAVMRYSEAVKLEQAKAHVPALLRPY
jgi:hypothetical protein